MIQKVQDFYYNVQDMKRAVDFYGRVLSCKIIDQNEWWTTLDLGGSRIGLHGTGGGAVPSVPRDAHGAHSGGTLTLHSDDFANDASLLKKAGVKILGEFAEHWGKILVFEDTEGNVLKLMQPEDAKLT